MSECDRLRGRLYDEDVRRALNADEDAPADLALHLARCPSCREEWARSRADLRWLAASLSEEAPGRLRLRAVKSMRATLPSRPGIDWEAAGLWASSACALGVCAVALAGPALTLVGQAVVVASATCAALAAEVTRQAVDASSI